MKRLILFFLAVVMALSLCACGDAESNTLANDSTAAGGNTNGGGDSNNNGGNNNNNNAAPQKKVKTFILKELSAVDYEYDDSDELSFEYDDLGNLIGMQTPYKQVTFDKHISRPLLENVPARQKRTVSTYDAAGRLLSRYEYDDEEGECEGETYTYDENGNLLSVEEYEDNTLDHGTRYTYDANGNRLTETQYNENGENYWITYTYDAQGNALTKVTQDELGRQRQNTYTYDENGNLIKDVYSYSISFGDRVEEHEDVFEYTYTYNNGKLVETKSAKNGQEVSRTENTYDEFGRLVRTFNTSRPNDVTVTYIYDAGGNMCQRDTDFGGKHQFKETFTYDANGNLVKLEGYKGDELRFEAALSYSEVEVTEEVAKNAADILEYLDLVGESEPEDPDYDDK